MPTVLVSKLPNLYFLEESAHCFLNVVKLFHR